MAQIVESELARGKRRKERRRVGIELRQKAEATLHVSGCVIHADATEEDMYAAIDLLADKLDRCIKKHKEKRTDHHAAEARALRI